jgi:hypothetical protein
MGKYPRERFLPPSVTYEMRRRREVARLRAVCVILALFNIAAVLAYIGESMIHER